jgi:carboxyl-terminal processing protease
MQHEIIRFSLIACLVAVIALMTLPFSAQKSWADESALDQQAKEQGIPIDQLRIFAEVMERIRAAYIDDVSDEQLLESAVRGMLYELDPHSVYFTPTGFDDLQTSTTGEFGGLGIEVTMENGFVKVVSPLDDTPASRAGLKPGDLILEIDGTFVKGKTLAEAVELLRGPIDSPVELSILSIGTEKPRTIELKRAIIKLRSVRSEMLEPGYGYLRITQFQAKTGVDAKAQLQQLMDEGDLQGLILDLRNNPGGLLSAAVELSDLFLQEGLVTYIQGRSEESRTDYVATPGDMLGGLPLVVLINAGSASAAEIVAGALQDQKRGILVGQRTFGKGSVQTILPLHNNHGLKLTTARYYTPRGRSIQAEGISPDIQANVASVTLNEEAQFRESDLPGHLENTQSNNNETDNSNRQLATEDYMLYEGLSILKGITLSNSMRQGAQ